MHISFLVSVIVFIIIDGYLRFGKLLPPWKLSYIKSDFQQIINKSTVGVI